MAWLDSVRDKRKAEEKEAEAAKEAEALKKKFEESEAARTRDSEALKSVQTEFEKVKAQLALAEATRNQPQAPQQPAKPEEPIDFNLDPEGALRQRMRPVAEATVLNSAMTARILAQQQLSAQDSVSKAMDGRLFQAWADDIDAESRKYQAIQLTSPQAWIGIFYYLKGIRAEELRDPESRKKKYAWLEPAQRTQEPEEKKPKEELTDQEKHVAKKMGVSEENYLKRKKAMQFVNS